jgi:hypothetical protein
LSENAAGWRAKEVMNIIYERTGVRYANEKISEKHYKLLIGRISDSANKQQSANKLSSSLGSTTQGSPIKR